METIFIELYATGLNAPPALTFDTLNIAGRIDDPTVTSVTVGAQTVPVSLGAFSADENVSALPTTITLNVSDAAGNSSIRTLTIQ